MDHLVLLGRLYLQQYRKENLRDNELLEKVGDDGYEVLKIMKREVLKKELDKIVGISKEFGAKKVLLFGSCLEDIKSAHDIDIAVEGINPREFFKYYGKVSMAIEDEVDILDLGDVREHLYKRILSKGIVLYERGV